MPKGKKDELAYVSFHFLEKGTRSDDGTFTLSSFSQSTFDALVSKIESQPEPDIAKLADFDAVKFGRIVPFIDTERVNSRTFRGRFDSAYFGHSYKNSEKGKISADSINQRTFHFILYFSKSGRIYIGTQYLGMYGDYGTFSRVILRMLGLGPLVRSSIIRSDAEELKGLVPTEVKITLSQAAQDIAKKGLFNKGSLVVFKPGGDNQFANRINQELIPLKGRPEREIKKKVAQLLSEGEAYSVSEDDIENCVISARKVKRRGTSTIYLLGDGNRATKFPLNVKMDDDGHPEIDKTKAEILLRLKTEIISKLEDV